MLDAYVTYGVAWLMFGAAHSALAGDTIKQRLLPRLGPSYRLIYNIFAIFTFAALLLYGLQLFQEPPAIEWGRQVKIWLGLIEISGWVLLFIAAGGYDMSRFVGTAQLKSARQTNVGYDDEPLRTAGLHRFVRHPLYSAAFLILWGAIWTPFGLATAVYGSVYLLIGTWSEERKLLVRYGEAYALYKSRVPAFVPWRGRAI